MDDQLYRLELQTWVVKLRMLSCHRTQVGMSVPWRREGASNKGEGGASVNVFFEEILVVNCPLWKARTFLTYKLGGQMPLFLEIAPLASGVLPTESIPFFQKLYIRSDEITFEQINCSSNCDCMW